MDLADVKTDQFEYHFKHNILKLNVLHFQYRVYITFENQCDWKWFVPYGGIDFGTNHLAHKSKTLYHNTKSITRKNYSS